jgi:3-oxoisoapionate decarboxylase
VRLGVSSFTFSWAIGVTGSEPRSPLTVWGLLERAADLGVGVLQVADNLPLHRLTGDERLRLREEATARGISVEVGTRGVARDHLRRYVAIALELGSPVLRTVTDTADHRPGPEEIVAALGPLTPELEDAGVHLAIENHDRFSAPALVAMLEALDSEWVGVCLDTANSLGALEGPRETVAVLAPFAANLHLKDVAARRVPSQLGMVIEGTPAGRGQVDLPWVVEQVRKRGRSGANAILELWTPPEATLEATLSKESLWAQESVRYLRTIIAD